MPAGRSVHGGAHRERYGLAFEIFPQKQYPLIGLVV